MKILFIIDRIELKYFEFNDLVTNFWLIKVFLKRGHHVDIATIDNLFLKNSVALAHIKKSYLKDENIFYEKADRTEIIENYDLVIFRPDPPVDLDYINATYIFDFVDENKVKVINSPKAIRNFNEKLHTVKFNNLMSENIVTNSAKDILEFLDTHKKLVLKPLNGCFGAGVMLLDFGDANTAAIINAMTDNGKRKIMVQKYIDGAQNGDKRVLFLGEKVLHYAVRKLPGENDFKFNEHCDKNIVKAELTNQELQNFGHVAKELTKLGLPLVGLDVIEGKIIEINVTSPCYFIREINHHFGIKLEDEIVDYIEKFSY
ncbi:hypothetical protein J6S88_01640 [bacterium]|nr:hypothetical protein [bacterium]